MQAAGGVSPTGPRAGRPTSRGMSPTRSVSPRSRSGSPTAQQPPTSPTRSRTMKRTHKPVTRDMLVACDEKGTAAKGGRIIPQYWLYTSFEYKMSIKEEQALSMCCRKIDHLCEKLAKTEGRGHLVMDIVATRKQIERGGPLCLGKEIYRFVEDKYFDLISTAFVGLTDNYARRVGRDVYCRSEELSPKKYDFDYIDNERMFIVYP